MDEKRATISHFSGVIRIVVTVLLVVALCFLFVRWAQNRRSMHDRADKASQTVTRPKKSDTSNSSARDKATEKHTPEDNSGSNKDSAVPTGFNDTGPSIPQTGIEVSLAVLGLAMFTVYLVGYNLQILKAKQQFDE